MYFGPGVNGINGKLTHINIFFAGVRDGEGCMELFLFGFSVCFDRLHARDLRPSQLIVWAVGGKVCVV